jgi:predicted amidohydrolase YtcJ
MLTWEIDAPVWTGRSSARGLTVSGSVLAAVGPHTTSSARGRKKLPTWSLPPGAIVVPGLRDPHIHLASTAAALLSVDCSCARSVTDVLSAVATAATALPPSAWLRGWGWDEMLLVEGRAPSLFELDLAGGDHPVVLHHRTGHAAALNSRARQMLEIESPRYTPDVSLVVDDREMLSRVPRLDPSDLLGAVSLVGKSLVAAGVTSVTDASATNSRSELELLDQWAVRGALPMHVNALASPAALGDIGRRRNHDRAHCSMGLKRVRVIGGKVATCADEIEDTVRLVRDWGWPVAVHAVDVAELAAALSALRGSGPPTWGLDRIEHAGLVPPELIAAIRSLSVAVVTNPSFVRLRARKYLKSLSEVELAWLYPAKSLLDAGVTLAAASDSPVTPARPLHTAFAARWRTASDPELDGVVLGPQERVNAAEALALVSVNAARVSGEDGRLRAGARADFTILDRHATEAVAQDDSPAPGPPSVPGVLATVVAGTVQYRDSRIEAAPSEVASSADAPDRR